MSLKRISLVLLLVFCLCPPVLAVDAAEAVVFAYHRFGDARYPSTNIGPEQFRQHLQLLHEYQANVISLGRLIAALDAGEPLPPRSVALTVDDAFQSFLSGALPLLEEYGYPATLFVSTDMVGGNDYLDWGQLRQLQVKGIEIGNHSAGHDPLVDRLPGESQEAWAQRVEEDLNRADALFKRELGRIPELFAFPYGEFDPQLCKIIEGHGFRAAFGQQSGVVTASLNRFSLPRFPVAGVYADPQGFRSKLQMRALPVTVLSPEGTLVLPAQNPPRLKVRIDMNGLDPQSLKCYVAGQDEAHIETSGYGEGQFEIQAQSPLRGRRSKYTITASDFSGTRWYWFSQLWVLVD